MTKYLKAVIVGVGTSTKQGDDALLSCSVIFRKDDNMSNQESTKKCTKCQEVKPISEFYKDHNRKDGLYCFCKQCESIRRPKRYLVNKEKIIEQSKIWRQNNKIRYNEKRQIWILKNAIFLKQYHKEYNREHRKYRNELKKLRLKRNHNLHIIENIRSRMYMIFKGYNKSKNTIGLLGCSAYENSVYLQKQFYGNMTLDNYGKVWQIDHIIPLSFFNMNDPVEQQQAFHYTNTRPLLIKDNLEKNNKILRLNFNNPAPFI